ncbi:MAG: thioredoxin [Rudanella sp.]|nr:thioredoxin [Rudanella sp.]
MNNTHDPILIPAKTAVLLVFVPSVSGRESISQRLSLIELVETLQQQLGGLVRVLTIDETLHSDVVRSFDVRQLPAFVLVQQGIEIWRHEGMLDEVMLANLSHWMLEMVRKVTPPRGGITHLTHSATE